jgi:hypothetical protein
LLIVHDGIVPDASKDEDCAGAYLIIWIIRVLCRSLSNLSVV